MNDLASGKELTRYAVKVVEGLPVFDVAIGVGTYGRAVAVAVALVAGVDWCMFRDVDKDHGTQQRIEGHRITIGSRAALFWDGPPDRMLEAKMHLQSLGVHVVTEVGRETL